MRLRYCARLISVLLGMAASAWAQTDAEPNVPDRGFEPSHSYSLSQIETIDDSSGTVNLAIPVAALPKGRAGLSSALMLSYNSQLYDYAGWNDQGQNSWYAAWSQWGNWRYGYQYGLVLDYVPSAVQCGPPVVGASLYVYRLRLAMPDGSSKPLRMYGVPVNAGGFSSVSPDGIQNGGCPNGPARLTGTFVFVSTDGSYVRVQLPSDRHTAWTSQTWTASFPDGKRVTGIGNQTSTITDRNNNTLRVTNVTLSNGHPATRVLDDLGRYMQVEHASSSQDLVTWQGFQDPNRLATTVNWGTYSAVFTYTCSFTNPDSDPCPGGNTFQAVSSIQLPAAYSGGPVLSYNFGYNAGTNTSYGELNSITTPSAAHAQYSYTEFTNTSGPVYVLGVSPISIKNKTLTYPVTNDGVTATITEPTQYSFSKISSSKTDPAGGVTNSYFFVTTDVLKGGRVYKVPDSNGNPVQSAATSYVLNKNGDTLIKTEYDWSPYGNIPRDSNGRITGAPPGAAVRRSTTSVARRLSMRWTRTAT